ncbi:T9SS type A sorting domain-containing protein [Tamlana sp. 62-3]|uniref:T9SS type A sorting domain-containing protein n=1 Tax=Neotamlana sargassicola TaxID=2883125 RepID=A0A9X1I672_9FLAO|nr:chondroitinase-B domain-containing protein [Tamlana sargassicola]MCB4808017.1 T9SS type A sorting domain-containing protein [Tamlana sargassicola]
MTTRKRISGFSIKSLFKNMMLLLILLFAKSISSQTFTDADDLKSAVNAATNGGIFIVSNGSYADFEATFENMASESEPIVIKAETVGGVTLTGESSFVLKKSSHITIEGFVFNVVDAGTIIKLEGCNNIRISRNVFEQSTTSSAKWLYIGGVWDDTVYPFQYPSHNNRIDHNIFKNKSNLGNYLTIDGSTDDASDTPYQSQYDRIDHNYFYNNGPRATNEQESIRIGWSEMSQSSGYTTVEFNLFEDCDGDPEIISVKSCDNLIRHNTFLKSYGTLSLRHGNRNRVEGNYFFGDGKAIGSSSTGSSLYTGGIRIYGTDHVIINNYMEGLTGTRWDAPITLTLGDAIDGQSTSWSKHFRAEDVVIAYNTLVNNSHGIEIGYDNNDAYNKDLENITIANNLITGSENAMVEIVDTNNDQGDKITWINNLMYPTGTAQLLVGATSTSFDASEVVNENPYLEFDADSGVYKTTADTPVYTNGISESVSEDIEGQTRAATSNPGADNFSAESIRYAPLTTNDVGPYAYEDGEETETLYVSPISGFEAEGGAQTVTVTSNLDWTVNETAEWVSVSLTSGSNNGSFTITVSENTTTEDRSTSIEVAGGTLSRTITVTQSAADLTSLYTLINTGESNDPVSVEAFSKEEVNGTTKFNYATNTLDKDNGTVWAADDGELVAGDYKGDGEYIIYDLGAEYELDLIQFTTTNKSDAFGYQIWVSTTGTNATDFSRVLPSSGDLILTATGTTDFNQYEIETNARYVKLLGFGRFNADGNTRTSVWSAIGEIEFFGEASVLSNVLFDKSNISIYPNPTSNYLIVDNPGFEATKVELYRLNGALILSQNITESALTIDTSKFSGGLYVLSVFNNEKLLESKRIVISANK